MTSDREQLQAAAIAARTRINDKLGDVWWSLLARGLLALAIGVAALFWPKATLVLLIRLIAVYALVDGAIGLISAFRARDLRSNLAPGLISIVVGLILALWPGTGAVTIAWTIGIAALLIGASLVYLALRLRKIDRQVEHLRRPR
jgi:uncharacterized membrane protein HdeD (DUF308 family)